VQNPTAQTTVEAARLHAQHQRPLYNTYGFSQIPQTVLHALTGAGHAGLPVDVWGELPRRWDKLIVILIDAFGWHQIERYAEQYAFLRRFFDKGVVSQLTTQFPSTTTAHITTMYTGLPVGQHGLYEWFTYEPVLGRVVIPLLSAETEHDAPRNGLLKSGIKPQQLYPLPSFSQSLVDRGATSVVLMPREFLTSAYNDTLCQGAKIIPRITLSQGLRTMADLVTQIKGPASFYFYLSEIDTLAHRFGPASREVDAEVDTLFTALERLLYTPLAGRTDTAIILTADHGQVRTNPDGLTMLDADLPQLHRMIKLASDGRPIAPAGSPRDVFLHLKPEAIDDAYGLLNDSVGAEGIAEVYRTRDLIEQGYFGEVGPRFIERVGDVAALALDDHVLWFGDGRDIPHYFGMHGGLHPDEMLTHFSVMPLA